MNQRRRIPSGFTLVEVLTTIVIIAMLVGLLLPAVQGAREAARVASCRNKLKQLSSACLAHLHLHGFFPSGGWDYSWTGDPDRGFGGTQPGGWAYSVLPYLEQTALHQLGAGLGDTARRPLTQQRTATPVAAFYCPSRRRARAYPAAASEVPFNCGRSGTVAKSDYAANGGDWKDPDDFVNGPTFDCLQTFPACSGGRISGPASDWLGNDDLAKSTGVVTRRSEFKQADFTDGMSVTLLVGEKYLNPDRYRTNNGSEAADNNDAWLGKDWDTIRWTSQAPRCDAPGVSNNVAFGSAHAVSLGVASCDGAVRTVAYTIDPTVWRRLGNRRDADSGPASWPGR